MVSKRHENWLWTFLCIVTWSTNCFSQTVLTWPFLGQGISPSSPVVVKADLHLERIIAINQQDQSWRAIHWIHLSWEDPRAMAAIVTATSSWGKAIASGQNAQSSTCSRTCDSSSNIEAGCCDSIWLPHIDLPNLLEFPYQDFPPRWRIWLEPITKSDNSTSYIVHWSVRLDGTWFSPYDFRAWPFEHQHLLLEMQPAPSIANKVALVFGDLSNLKNTPTTKGEDLAGWYINTITPRAYDTSACYQKFNTTFSTFSFDNDTGVVEMNSMAPNDWLLPSSARTLITTVTLPECGNINNEAISQYGPRVLVLDVMMVRVKTYYAMTNIVPIILVDLMVFVVYAMDKSDLEARMGVVLLMVLSMCALQSMYDFPPAAYLNVVQQLTVVSFVLFALVAIECLIASAIFRYHESLRKQRAGLSKLKSGPSKGLFKSWSKQHWVLGGHPGPSGRSIYGPEDDAHVTTDNIEQQPSVGRVQAPPYHGNQQSPSLPSNVPSIAAPYLSGSLPDPVSAVHSRRHQTGQPVAEADEGRPSGDSAKRLVKFRPGSNIPMDAAESVEDEEMGGEDASTEDVSKQARRLAAWGTHGLKRATRAVGDAVTLRKLQTRISDDEAYAQRLATKLDTIASIFLLVSFMIVLIIILAVGAQVGDHKLMLYGSMPGNMRR